MFKSSGQQFAPAIKNAGSPLNYNDRLQLLIEEEELKFKNAIASGMNFEKVKPIRDRIKFLESCLTCMPDNKGEMEKGE